MWEILTWKNTSQGWGSFGLEAVPHDPSDSYVEEGSGLRKTNRPAGRHNLGWAPAASVHLGPGPACAEGAAPDGWFHFPALFPFTLFIGFKNDFVVESEQT